MTVYIHENSHLVHGSSRAPDELSLTARRELLTSSRLAPAELSLSRRYKGGDFLRVKNAKHSQALCIR